MISRFLILAFTLMIFNCAQLSKTDTSTRAPSSEKSALADLIKTEYGEYGVCAFNNHRNIYLQEVRSNQKEFSMYHVGPVNFDIKEFKNYPKLVPDMADAKIGYITLFNKRCVR